MIRRTLVLTLGTFALAFQASAASAQQSPAQQAPAKTFCGDTGSKNPVIEPGIPANLGYTPTDNGFDCHAWQVFIGLNWPVLPQFRGMPNGNVKLGTPGTTVWESYKTLEQTFLPNAIDPGPWQSGPMLLAAVPADLTAQVASGQIRALARVSKISPRAIAQIARTKVDPAILQSITQAGGGTLYDQQKEPVYYEIAMNADQYNYIQRNGLYNAQTQLTFATTKTIMLPGGVTEYGNESAIELKAAWKILTQDEINSGRFHTTQALIVGTSAIAQKPVMVGLVGLHIFQMVGASAQGMWATFAHDDNAPVSGNLGISRGTFTFYNPNCQPAPCAINNMSTNPTQVVQMFPDKADSVNAPMKAMLQAYGAGPWQYYKLINVQWPQNPVLLSTLTIPAMITLPTGNLNTDTLTNPVLETYQQASGTGCMACHIYGAISSAQTPAPPAPNNASSYSFTFGYAQVPPQ